MGPAGGADLPGNVGPDLSEIGGAGRPDEYLWNYVNDARVYNPATIMPPYYVVDGMNRVVPSLRGKPILSAEQIEDVVAFLATLKN